MFLAHNFVFLVRACRFTKSLDSASVIETDLTFRLLNQHVTVVYRSETFNILIRSFVHLFSND